MGEFFDEERYVRDAPNRHNTKCGSLSVWDIISRHPDFAKGNKYEEKQMIL